MEQSGCMRTVVFVAMIGVCAPVGAAAGQARPAAPRRQGSPPAATASQVDRKAEAYAEFLRAHMLGDAGNVDEAITAYRRAMSLDPSSATIPAELAEFYAGENRATDAQA